jgi:hypothetical protein
MSLDKSMKNLKFDKRMIEWSLNNGQLTQEELKAHLASLPDMGHNIALNVPDEDPLDKADQH